MLDRLLNTQTFMTAQGAMDGIAARHAALTDNIANINTPGYQRKEVPFEQQLAAARSQGFDAGGRTAAFRPTTITDHSGTARQDGNNVDIEMEMVALADNSLRYEVMAQYVSGFFSGLKGVIQAR